MSQAKCSRAPTADTLRISPPSLLILAYEEFEQITGWDHLPEIVPCPGDVDKVVTKSQLVFGIASVSLSLFSNFRVAVS